VQPEEAAEVDGGEPFSVRVAPWESAPPAVVGGHDSERRARDLLCVACHDLCAPLRAIQMHVRHTARQLLRGEEIDREWLASMMRRLDRVAGEGARMVDDVLALERLERRPSGIGAD
jgi:signal transduction histidine kinase